VAVVQVGRLARRLQELVRLQRANIEHLADELDNLPKAVAEATPSRRRTTRISGGVAGLTTASSPVEIQV
jgi:hypothetical protein